MIGRSSLFQQSYRIDHHVCPITGPPLLLCTVIARTIKRTWRNLSNLTLMFKYGLRRYESSLNMQSKQEMSMSRAAHQSCNGFQDTLYIVLRIDISSPYNGDWGFQLKSIVAEFCKSKRKDHEYKRQSRDLTGRKHWRANICSTTIRARERTGPGFGFRSRCAQIWTNHSARTIGA